MRSHGPARSWIGVLLLWWVSIFPAEAASLDSGEAPSASGPVLEEIQVTARHRPERLDQVPLSVTVVSAEDLETTYTGSLADVSTAGPDLAFHTVGQFGHSSSLTIRGVGGGGANLDADPGVAVYVDGQYQTVNTINLETLLGVDSIEILRGPQGTLFGRNAFGGAINITTVNPSGALTAEATATVGDFGRRNLTAALEFPIDPQLSARLDFGSVNSNGYYHNVLDDEPIGGDAVLTLRPTVLWRPSDDLTLVVKIPYIDDQSDPTPTKYALDPPAGLFGLLNPGEYANWGNTQLSPQGTGGPFAVGFTNRCSCNFLKMESPSVRADYESAWGHWTAITGGQRIDGNIQADATGTPVPLLLTEIPYSIRVLTQEVRLHSAPVKRLSLTTGFYGLYDELREGDLQYTVLGGPAATTWSQSLQRRDSLAAYGEAEYAIAPSVRVTAGARYTYEEKHFRYGAPVPAEEEGDIAVLSGPYPYTPLAARWRNLSPELSISYSPDTNTLLYASWSRGFKAGGFQALASSVESAGPYGDEQMDATEIGVKASFAENRARLSADVFYENIQGLQRNVVQLIDGITNNLTTNAANAISEGVEFEGAWKASDSLMLQAHSGFLDARYTSFCADFVATNASRPACGNAPDDVDNTNLVPSNAPRWTAAMSGEYERAVGPELRLRLHVQQSWTSPLWTADDNDPLSRRASQGLLDASLRLGTSDDRYYAQLWGRNLTDRVVTEFAVMAYPLFTLWNPTAPRSFGLTVGARFGEPRSR